MLAGTLYAREGELSQLILPLADSNTLGLLCDSIQSQDIFQASFVYDPETDDRRMQKTLLMFQQMVSRPLTIKVRPVFTLNYELFIAVSCGFLVENI